MRKAVPTEATGSPTLERHCKRRLGLGSTWISKGGAEAGTQQWKKSDKNGDPTMGWEIVLLLVPEVLQNVAGGGPHGELIILPYYNSRYDSKFVAPPRPLYKT